MHVVTKTDKGTGQAVRIEIPSRVDPTALLVKIAGEFERKLSPEEHERKEAGYREALRILNGGEPVVEPSGPYTPIEHPKIPTKADLLAGLPKVAPTGGVRDTSIEAYRKLAATGKLSGQQKIVFDYLKASIGGRTRQEIARDTGLKINAVCGRVNELMNDFSPPLVYEPRKKTCSVTKEKVNAIEVAP